MGNLEEKTALATIDLLARRLQRLSFLLTGKDEAEELPHDAAGQEKDQTVFARLAIVESGLRRLSNNSPALGGLLKLYSAHPDLFQPTTSDIPSTSLTTSELLAIVSSCATSYPNTASRLTSINDVPIPSVDSSVSLISLQPRLARLKLLQEAHAKTVADLRLRSAATLQRWYEIGVLGGGECWTEWEGRVTTVEKRVRREEALQAREIKNNEAYGA